jgi:hypothetical protein
MRVNKTRRLGRVSFLVPFYITGRGIQLTFVPVNAPGHRLASYADGATVFRFLVRAPAASRHRHRRETQNPPARAGFLNLLVRFLCMSTHLVPQVTGSFWRDEPHGNALEKLEKLFF